MNNKYEFINQCSCGAKFEFCFDNYFYSEAYEKTLEAWFLNHKDCPRHNFVKKEPFKCARKRGDTK